MRKEFVHEIGCSAYGWNEDRECRSCLVSGDACMFFPRSSLACARKYHEGPDVDALEFIENALGYTTVSKMKASEINDWLNENNYVEPEYDD